MNTSNNKSSIESKENDSVNINNQKEENNYRIKTLINKKMDSDSNSRSYKNSRRRSATKRVSFSIIEGGITFDENTQNNMNIENNDYNNFEGNRSNYDESQGIYKNNDEMNEGNRSGNFNNNFHDGEEGEEDYGNQINQQHQEMIPE